MFPSYPRSENPLRSGWRVGALVFAIALLTGATIAIVLLWGPGQDRSIPQPERAPSALPLRRMPHFPSSARLDAFLATPPAVFRLAATNLVAVVGRPRPLATATNALAPLRGVIGDAARTNRLTGATNEPAVLAALRASRGQPIPKEVADLAREITRDCQTETARAKALYDWITGHITYDWKVWNDILAGADAYTQPQDPLSVLQRGTAVCAGYAWLFDALAASAGLDATFVIGNVRGYRGTADDTVDSKYLHAWNSVQIDGQWQLLDAT